MIACLKFKQTPTVMDVKGKHTGLYSELSYSTCASWEIAHIGIHTSGVTTSVGELLCNCNL